jgi:uncharacterized protein DUF3224
MSMHSSATFEVESWDEQPILAAEDGTKVTRASVTMTFDGDLSGKGSVEWLMSYEEDGTAIFVGLERVIGELQGRSGSFVLQHVGRFNGRLAEASLTVLAGSSTGELAGLSGTGTLEAGFGPDGVRSLTLDHSR